MALQGTIETFSLSDVLRLLADTHKTGVLRLVGTRGSGEVHVADGRLTWIEVDGLPDDAEAADAVFQLLRFPDGSFTFDQDGRPKDAEEPKDLEPVLGEATTRLAEWQEITAVIPSSATWLSLSASLSRSDVVVDNGRWQAIAAIGSGASVADLGSRLDLDEVASCRLARELVELGMVEVAEEPVAEQPEPLVAPDPIVTPEASNGWDTGLPPIAAPEGNGSTGLSDFGLDELPSDSPNAATPPPLFTDEPGLPDPLAAPEGTRDPLFAEPTIAEPSGLPEPTAFPEPESDLPPVRPTDATEGPDPSEAAEVARQLANLSPRAARAVAAAARASTQEERDAALAEVDAEEGDSLNRGLLMKFLSSVQD